MINLNIYVGDLQKPIFEGFTVHPGGNVGTLIVKRVNARFLVTVKTGKLTCTTSKSASEVKFGLKPRARVSRETTP